MKIAIVEDNQLLAKQLEMVLKKEGYEVEVYNDGDSFFLNLSDIDLLLLDVSLPDTDGFHILKTLNEFNYKIKTIFITSYTDIEYLKKGYELGCEDYLKKPFEIDELLLKVKKVQKDIFGESKIKIGNYFFDLENFVVYFNNNMIKITKREAEILRIFLNNIDKVVTFDYLNEKIWNSEVVTNTIIVAVLRLKKKLNLENLENVREVGYIFHKL